MPERFNLSDLMFWVAEQTEGSVNFADLSGITYEIPCLRLRADQYYHTGHYCEFVKRSGGQPLCSANKEVSKALARRRMRPFSGECRFGLWDAAFPVDWNGSVMGIIYIGGFRSGRDLAAVQGRRYSGPSIPVITEELERRILHYGSLLAANVSLVLDHWHRHGNGLGKKRSADFYADALKLFIEAQYHRDVHLADFARDVRLHPNYASQIVAKCAGTNFRTYLQHYRIERAKTMLASQSLSVTEVAFRCGFNDSNYFSTVFRRFTSVTPTEYRNGIAAQDAGSTL